jgi:hypothetical protein
VLIDPEPMLPTRGYRVLCRDATLIDLEAEAMWPIGTQLEWTLTTLVIERFRAVALPLCGRASGERLHRRTRTSRTKGDTR